MTKKFDVLAGKKVVFTGKREDRPQTHIFNVGEEYDVVRHGVSVAGEGVMIDGEHHGYVILEGNFIPAEVAKPTPLNLRQFLEALYDEEEVVSIDPDGDCVDDTYGSLEGLADDLISYEIEDNDFYLASEWNEYTTAVRALDVAKQELAEQEEEDVPVPAEPEALTFDEAVIKLVNGIGVYSVDKDGDRVDSYYTVSDLRDLAPFEATECKWYEM